MDALEIGPIGERRFGERHVEVRIGQRVQHSGQALRALHVAAAGPMLQHFRMGEDGKAQRRIWFGESGGWRQAGPHFSTEPRGGPPRVLRDDPMTGVCIRPARAEEAHLLAGLAEATFRETFLEGFKVPYPAADLAAFSASAFDPSMFATDIAAADEGVWIAERDGAPVGYATAGACKLPHPDARPEHGELKRIYLLNAAQGSGLGRALFAEAISWLESRRPGPLWIGVWSGNLKAQRFYERNGFAKVGEYEFPVGSWRDHEFIMRRR
jgi:diamine N-acetyltransferase